FASSPANGENRPRVVLDRVVSHMPLQFDNTEAVYQRGIALHRAGRLPDAASCYHQVLQMDPRHAGALYNLGALYIDCGRPDQAIAYLTRSMEIQPRNPQACNAMGEAYRAQRDGVQALEWYARAIALDPANYSAYNNRGIVEAIMGHMGAAMA